MKRAILLLALLVTPAFAQQSPATIDQRIGAQIGALIIQNAGLQIQVEQLQADLKAAQDREKALRDKCEPKKD